MWSQRSREAKQARAARCSTERERGVVVWPRTARTSCTVQQSQSKSIPMRLPPVDREITLNESLRSDEIRSVI